MGKLVTILQHQAQYKYDLCKPTLLYDSVGERGHVGILLRGSGIKKISRRKFEDALLGVKTDLVVVEAGIKKTVKQGAFVGLASLLKKNTIKKHVGQAKCLTTNKRY